MLELTSLMYIEFEVKQIFPFFSFQIVGSPVGAWCHTFVFFEQADKGADAVKSDQVTNILNKNFVIAQRLLGFIHPKLIYIICQRVPDLLLEVP